MPAIDAKVLLDLVRLMGLSLPRGWRGPANQRREFGSAGKIYYFSLDNHSD
jgi:hypothetical protein